MKKLLSIADIAEHTGFSVDHVKRRIVCLPDFPRAIRIPSPTGGKGHPRWRETEVDEWLESYRESA